MKEKIIKAIVLATVLHAPIQAVDLTFSNSIETIQHSLSENPRQVKKLSASLVDQWLNINSFTELTFKSYIRDTLESYKNVLTHQEFELLVDQYENQLANVFRKTLVNDLNKMLMTTDFTQLNLTSIDAKGSLKSATVEIKSNSTSKRIEFRMRLDVNKWVILDIENENITLSEYYRSVFQKVTKNLYSLPVLVAQMIETDHIKLEDFSLTPVGQLPKDWGSWRKKDKGKPMPYRVEGTRQNYLAARDSGHSVILGKFLHWNPRQYPILSWCWRANHLPPYGNEFLNEANDSAVGLYVIFSQNWLRVPKQIKYVWSSTLPVGTVGRRNKMFRPWFFVKESGEKNKGHWQFEVVDLEHDHKLKLGGPPAKRTIGLGILSDANSTDSYAEGFYTDFRAWKRPSDGLQTISDHCGSLRKNN